MKQARDLSRLLRPRSVAVFGGRWAETVVAQCRVMGFRGEVWPVHPTKAEIAGARAFPSVEALPGAPDAAFVGVNRHATLEVVGALAARGAGGAVAFAAGWAEAGDPGLQAALVARAGAMPVLGPNCYGLINYLDGALLWPDQHGGRRVERGVAIVSQSSNIAINLTMQARGLPVAYVACLGNAAQVGLAELCAALVADERVTALGLYVEGVGDAVAFARVAGALRAAGKGIVAIKGGRSAGGVRAAASHTAALAGEAVVSSAFLRQCGVAEVASPAELVEALKALHVHGPLAGRRVCSVSCSGGEAGLVADLAQGRALDFAAPEAGAAARLGELLGPLVAVGNPLDYHTFIWGDRAATEAVFATMLAGYDAGLFVIDWPRTDRCDAAGFEPALEAVVGAARATGRPAFACASLPETMPEAIAERLIGEGVAPLGGLETGLAAIEAAAVPAGRPGWVPLAPGAVAGRLLDEAAGKALLAEFGVAVPKGVVAADLPTLARRAAGLRPPLALKGLGFVHKTEAGAVRLGLERIEGEAGMPGAAGYLAEEMVGGVLAEVLVGVRRDPVYGASLTVGLGGVAAELLADTATLVLPVTAAEVGAALRSLRLWPLLDGHRGAGRPAVGEAVAVALRLAEALAARPEITEIEVNPLLLTAEAAVAADALVRMEDGR
jgi:acetate---CoA ligase (ADP-forming)